jgi:NTE family protein
VTAKGDAEVGRRFDRGPTRSTRDDAAAAVIPGTALCLSGGGFRAMLFHLGGLWRLNELGTLPTLDRVTAVSGGAIAAGALAAAWPSLEFDDAGRAEAFGPRVVDPLRALATRTLDVRAALLGVLLPGGANGRLATQYRRRLLGRRMLADLPERPEFIFTATGLQSGGMWLFSRRYMSDFRVGRVDDPDLPLAVAVAASSAFPPFLSPALLRLSPSHYAADSGLDLDKAPYRTRPALTDGGVYDNLGLEAAFKRYRTILVSDAGAHIADMPRPPRTWGLAMLRVTHVIDNQVRELRKQRLLESYERGDRDGAYWGIRSDLANFPVTGTPPAPPARTARLASIPTRLARIEPGDQERLINWGYTAADAALRSHVRPEAPAPDRLPYPDSEI